MTEIHVNKDTPGGPELTVLPSPPTPGWHLFGPAPERPSGAYAVMEAEAG